VEIQVPSKLSAVSRIGFRTEGAVQSQWLVGSSGYGNVARMHGKPDLASAVHPRSRVPADTQACARGPKALRTPSMSESAPAAVGSRSARPRILSVKAIVRTTAVAAILFVASFGGVQASAVPGGDIAGALTFGGLPRTYQVHVPAGLESPTGLVINLHGAGQTGHGQAALTNYNAVADQHGFVVAYPDGIDFSWADGRGASIPDRQGVDDVGFLVALIDRLTRDFGIAPGRVFVTGMSAGAFMATRLACERADIIAAVAPVAGTLGSAFPCAPSRPVSVLQMNGTADQVVPFNGGTMLGRGGYSDIVAAPAMAQRWRELDDCTATGCADGTDVVFIQIDGGGHDWPADASHASGQFFATHGR
jgi:polyhydroxybutyrate depolymerase